MRGLTRRSRRPATAGGGSSPGYVAANAVRRTVTDFAGDAASERRLAGLMAWHAKAMQGRTGLAYVGDVSDPSVSFNGALPYMVQDLTGNAGLGGNPNVRGTAPTLTNSLSGTPYDPTLALLYQRMKRQAHP